MKSIDTLVEDIYSVFDQEIHVTPEETKAFGEELARVVVEQVSERKDRHLRLSNVGTPCRRKLWYTINASELAERMPGHARIKFLIGHVTEAVILFLARLAGHAVTDEQRTVELHGIRGHIDALVDGELVDVKSTSPYSFNKFKEGLTRANDAFGYLSQLGTYAAALNLKRGHFLPVDKVLGKLHLDSHDLPEKDYASVISEVQGVLASNVPPDRAYTDEPMGSSGNRKLCVACSYCEYKTSCWPGVQPFQYSHGVTYLTKVVRPPKVDRVEQG